MNLDLRELYKAYYPMHKPTTPESDPWRKTCIHYPKLSFLCNKCGAKIIKGVPRIWGNPYCGVCFRGPAHIEHLTYCKTPPLRLWIPEESIAVGPIVSPWTYR